MILNARVWFAKAVPVGCSSLWAFWPVARDSRGVFFDSLQKALGNDVTEESFDELLGDSLADPNGKSTWQGFVGHWAWLVAGNQYDSMTCWMNPGCALSSAWS